MTDKKRLLQFSILSLFVFAFLVSAVSATVGVTIQQVQSITQTQNGTITVRNTGNVTESISLSSSGNFNVLFSTTEFNLEPGVTSSQITVSPINLGTVDFGGKSTTITATARAIGETDHAANLTMTVKGSFCNAGEAGGNLEITDIKIDNNGDGKDDEWNLLDEIEITVEVENNGDDSIDDIFVEMGFFDSTGNNQVSDLEFDNADEEEFDIGRIRDNDKEEVVFKFKVPADFDDGNYKLTVKAYSDDLGENNECTSESSDLSDDLFQDVSVDRESDVGKFISFDNIEFMPLEPTCGESVTVSLDVFNIGDEDQDQVKINLKNTELGINQFVEIRNDLDQGDKEGITFDFTIPATAQNKFYSLLLSSEYDYRSGNYREESEEDTVVQLRVLGCSDDGQTPDNGGNGDRVAIISAKLDSDEAVAGGDVVVRATVTNLKSQSAVFVVDATGYDSWASLSDVEPRTVDIPAGQSRDVLLTFAVDEEAEGEESFSVKVTDGQGKSETRVIGVNISGSDSGSSGSSFDFGDNTFLWIIGIVNVVLIVLIIIVAVRVARR